MPERAEVAAGTVAATTDGLSMMTVALRSSAAFAAGMTALTGRLAAAAAAPLARGVTN